jgi:hypothetical protein
MSVLTAGIFAAWSKRDFRQAAKCKRHDVPRKNVSFFAFSTKM